MSNVAIVLCTYNGQEFLKEQLQSFSTQTFNNWSLFVYDDRSTDGTEQEVYEYKKSESHNVVWSANAKQLGFSANFLNAILNTPDNFEFYALSDQDDIWLPEKLEHAIDTLKGFDVNTPNLYCARTILVNGVGEKIGQSPLFTKGCSFSNAIVQSIAGGNTMVFNKALRNLFVKVAKDIKVISHDWFIYQLVTGVGGNVYYDSKPSILYRQHGKNIIGSNLGFIARFSRIKKLMNNSFKQWCDTNILALQECSRFFTDENKTKLELFKIARSQSLISRLQHFYKSGIYRQTLLGNIGLIVGIILNKV